MRGAGELPRAFTGPTGYSSVWSVLAVLAVVLVVGWVVGVLWATRRQRPATASGAKAPGDPVALDRRRREALAAIDALAAAVAARQVDTRDAASRLSLLVREFVGAATGLAVPSMTLDDLRRNQVPHLPDLVSVLYPSEFARQVPDDAAPLVQRGRQLVSSWH